MFPDFPSWFGLIKRLIRFTKKHIFPDNICQLRLRETADPPSISVTNSDIILHLQAPPEHRLNA